MFGKILSFYTKYFAVWVVLSGVVAYLEPRPFIALKNYNEWFFALTMFGIGAVLQLGDFKRIVGKPIIVLIGCCAQFSIMPLGAFVLARLFRLPPEIAVGLILTGSAPGAMASNVMSYIAKADTAYSVSLTTASTLLCPLLTPGLTYLLAGSVLKVDFWPMMLSVIKNGNSAAVRRLRSKAPAQRKSGENPRNIPRHLRNIHNLHLLAGYRSKQKLPDYANRSRFSSSRYIEHLWNGSRLHRRFGFSDEHQQEKNSGN